MTHASILLMTVTLLSGPVARAGVAASPASARAETKMLLAQGAPPPSAWQGHPVQAPPPPPQVERVEPRRGWVWVAGNYEWRGGRYVWEPGHWERERPGWRWREGRWDRRGNQW